MADKAQNSQTQFTWDKTSQTLTLDLSSEPARKRFFWKLTAVVSAMILCAGTVFGTVWLLRDKEKGVVILDVEPPSEPPELVVAGNSGIPGDAIEEMVTEEVSVGLKKLNPYKVKEILEQRGQIRSAEVTKDFPDKLQIRISERQPILMLATQKADEPVQLWGVDDSGILFKPYNVKRMQVLGLPFLEGVKLADTLDGQTRIPGMEKVHYLLELLKREAYPVYDGIRTVSLAQFEEGEPELGATIVLNGREIRRIIFGVENFEYQVTKLISVLSLSGSVRLDEKEIDLSYDGDAIIR